MLNDKIHFNKNSFSKKPDLEAIREGYGQGLLTAGEDMQDVVALSADLTESTKTHYFKERFPGRFFEMGVGEQSMASVASGMASMGKIPFITSYAMFSPGRNWEQIRTTICYNNSNVKIIGSHSGVSVGPDGGTHQALEDIAITRVIPRMTVIVPCDSNEAKKATIAAAKHEGPVYIRLQREKTKEITTEFSPFEIGKAEFMHETKNPKITIFSCGAILHTAIKIALDLKDKIEIDVVNVSTIKPLDKAIVSMALKSNKVITIEEHQRAGGLGSAISELLSENAPMPIYRIGVQDVFGQSGTPEELLEHYGISEKHILEIIKVANSS